MLNKLEEDFQKLVHYLEENLEEGEHIQRKLKKIDEENIPNQYKRAFKFYQSLSGDSKVFLFRLAKKPSLKKQFFKSKNRGFTSIKKLKAYSSMNYFPE